MRLKDFSVLVRHRNHIQWINRLHLNVGLKQYNTSNAEFLIVTSISYILNDLSLNNIESLSISGSAISIYTHDPTIHDPTMHDSCVNYPKKLNYAEKTKFCWAKDRVIATCKHTLLRDITCNLVVLLNWLTFIYMLTESLPSTVLQLFAWMPE